LNRRPLASWSACHTASCCELVAGLPTPPENRVPDRKRSSSGWAGWKTRSVQNLGNGSERPCSVQTHSGRAGPKERRSASRPKPKTKLERAKQRGPPPTQSSSQTGRVCTLLLRARGASRQGGGHGGGGGGLGTEAWVGRAGGFVAAPPQEHGTAAGGRGHGVQRHTGRVWMYWRGGCSCSGFLLSYWSDFTLHLLALRWCVPSSSCTLAALGKSCGG